MVDPARWRIALILCLFAPDRAVAQDAPLPPPIDPLEALPPLEQDLGVEWPEPISPAETGHPPGPRKSDDETIRLRYTFDIVGLEQTDLQARFRVLSRLEQHKDIENIAQLNHAARMDAATLERLLRAEGFYAGRVKTDVTAPEADEPARVRLRVDPGPRYTFTSIEIAIPPEAPRDLITEAFSLNVGAPVDAAAVQAATDRVRVALPDMGYPFAKVGEPDVVIDHETHTATLRIEVTPGAAARVGQIRIEGARLVGSRHVVRLARFEPGEVYNARKIEDLRRALVATGLFGAVAIRAVPTANPGIVDIVVATEAAPLRTVAVQAGYSTGEGIRVEGSWQHRNLFPPEGALTVRGVLGTREQRLAAEFRRSNLRRRDQTLLLTSEVSHENRQAYEARSFSLGARLERLSNLIWQKPWIYSFGGELLASDERQTNRRRTFFIAALPLQLGYDGSDDLLDPKRGVRLTGRLSPELSLQSGVFGYTRAQIEGSAYLPLGGERIVAAGRLRAGSIFGAKRDRIAPSRRFYVGGGGSVRGFGFQDIGPRDIDNDPIGGRSFAEGSAELRFRFGDFGIVPFIDGGQVFASTLPKFNSFRFGAGLGARYYTSFGPIRLDVATPLDPRAGDPKVAVYVSIGQAF